jgi:hypothetical protein
MLEETDAYLWHVTMIYPTQSSCRENAGPFTEITTKWHV